MDKIKDLICNKCGINLVPKTEEDIGLSPHGLVNCKVQGGYFSEGLLDLNRYTFSLCELCLRKLFNEFLFPPLVEEFTHKPDNLWSKMDFSVDQEIWEFQEWERLGGHIEAYHNGLCNAIKNCHNEAIYSVKLSDELVYSCLCAEHKNKFQNCLNAELIPFDSSKK